MTGGVIIGIAQGGCTVGVISGVFFLNPLQGWVVGRKGVLLHTQTGGANWEVDSLGPGNLTDVYFVDNTHGWAWGAGQLWRTTDGGNSWSTQNLTQTITINNASALPNSGTSYVFKNYPFNIFATSDNFATYSLIAYWNISFYDILMFDHSIGWTQSAGPDWTQSIVKIQNLTTGIISNESNLLDAKLFPNPITSDAAILTYSLKEKAVVKIVLSDITGKLIKASEIKSESGQHSTVFDFSKVAKGIYLLQVNDGIRSSKIKVLKQ